jgi:hypothetical protein
MNFHIDYTQLLNGLNSASVYQTVDTELHTTAGGYLEADPEGRITYSAYPEIESAPSAGLRAYNWDLTRDWGQNLSKFWNPVLNGFSSVSGNRYIRAFDAIRSRPAYSFVDAQSKYPVKVPVQFWMGNCEWDRLPNQILIYRATPDLLRSDWTTSELNSTIEQLKTQTPVRIQKIHGTHLGTALKWFADGRRAALELDPDWSNDAFSLQTGTTALGYRVTAGTLKIPITGDFITSTRGPIDEWRLETGFITGWDIANGVLTRKSFLIDRANLFQPIGVPANTRKIDQLSDAQTPAEVQLFNGLGLAKETWTTRFVAHHRDLGIVSAFKCNICIGMESEWATIPLFGVLAYTDEWSSKQVPTIQPAINQILTTQKQIGSDATQFVSDSYSAIVKVDSVQPGITPAIVRSNELQSGELIIVNEPGNISRKNGVYYYKDWVLQPHPEWIRNISNQMQWIDKTGVRWRLQSDSDGWTSTDSEFQWVEESAPPIQLLELNGEVYKNRSHEPGPVFDREPLIQKTFDTANIVRPQIHLLDADEAYRVDLKFTWGGDTLRIADRLTVQTASGDAIDFVAVNPLHQFGLGKRVQTEQAALQLRVTFPERSVDRQNLLWKLQIENWNRLPLKIGSQLKMGFVYPTHTRVFPVKLESQKQIGDSLTITVFDEFSKTANEPLGNWDQIWIQSDPLFLDAVYFPAGPDSLNDLCTAINTQSIGLTATLSESDSNVMVISAKSKFWITFNGADSLNSIEQIYSGQTPLYSDVDTDSKTLGSIATIQSKRDSDWPKYWIRSSIIIDSPFINGGLDPRLQTVELVHDQGKIRLDLSKIAVIDATRFVLYDPPSIKKESVIGFDWNWNRLQYSTYESRVFQIETSGSDWIIDAKDLISEWLWITPDSFVLTDIGWIKIRDRKPSPLFPNLSDSYIYQYWGFELESRDATPVINNDSTCNIALPAKLSIWNTRFAQIKTQ